MFQTVQKKVIKKCVKKHDFHVKIMFFQYKLIYLNVLILSGYMGMYVDIPTWCVHHRSHHDQKVCQKCQKNVKKMTHFS